MTFTVTIPSDFSRRVVRGKIVRSGYVPHWLFYCQFSAFTLGAFGYRVFVKCALEEIVLNCEGILIGWSETDDAQ